MNKLLLLLLLLLLLFTINSLIVISVWLVYGFNQTSSIGVATYLKVGGGGHTYGEGERPSWGGWGRGSPVTHTKAKAVLPKVC